MKHNKKAIIFIFLIASLFIFSLPGAPNVQAQGITASLSDLQVKSVELLTPEVFIKEWVKVQVTVENAGTQDSSSFYVDLFKHGKSADTLGVKGELRHRVMRLGAGQSVKIDFLFRANEESYLLYVSLDNQNQIKETLETNNIYGPLAISVSGSRPDDDFEPNDTINSAKALGMGSTSLVSADEDYFRVSAKSGGYIEVKIEFDSELSNLDLRLFNNLKQEVASSHTYRSEERIFYRVPVPINYSGDDPPATVDMYIHVKAGSGKVPYVLSVKTGELNDLRVSFSSVSFKPQKSQPPSQATLDAIYEEYAQKGVELTLEQKALIQYNLTRYYYDVSVKVEKNPGVLSHGFFIDLYRNGDLPPAPGEIGDKSFYVSPNKFLVYDEMEKKYIDKSSYTHTFEIAVLGGNYSLFARVDSDNALGETHEGNNVTSARRISAGPEGVKDDLYEPNDAFTGGILLSPGVYKDLRAFDKDHYKVVLEPQKSVHISCDFLHSLGDLDLYLFDEGGHLLASSASSSNKEYISYLNATDQPQNLVIRVDDVEQNTRYSLALSISGPSQSDLAINRITYTPLEVSQGDTIEVRVYVQNKGNLDARNVRVDLFSLTGGAPIPVLGDVSADYNGVIDTLKAKQSAYVSFLVVCSEGELNFYSLVDTQNSLSESNEENNIFGPLSVHIGPGLVDDAYELSGQAQNDTVESARVLSQGAYNDLWALDEDWYKITLSPGQTLVSAIYFSHSLGDIDLHLYTKEDQDFVLQKSSYTLSDNEALSYKNTTSQSMDVYLRIQPINKANTYALELNYVSGAGFPDLIISSMVSYPSNPSPGDMVRTTVVAKNVGDAPTADISYLDFYYTQNSQPPAGKYGDLFDVIPSGFGPQETMYFHFEYKLDSGSYYLYSVIDTDNANAELVETNNVFGPKVLNAYALLRKIYNSSLVELIWSADTKGTIGS